MNRNNLAWQGMGLLNRPRPSHSSVAQQTSKDQAHESCDGGDCLGTEMGASRTILQNHVPVVSFLLGHELGVIAHLSAEVAQEILCEYPVVESLVREALFGSGLHSHAAGITTQARYDSSIGAFVASHAMAGSITGSVSASTAFRRMWGSVLPIFWGSDLWQRWCRKLCDRMAKEKFDHDCENAGGEMSAGKIEACRAAADAAKEECYRKCKSEPPGWGPGPGPAPVPVGGPSTKPLPWAPGGRPGVEPQEEPRRGPGREPPPWGPSLDPVLGRATVLAILVLLGLAVIVTVKSNPPAQAAATIVALVAFVLSALHAQGAPPRFDPGVPPEGTGPSPIPPPKGVITPGTERGAESPAGRDSRDPGPPKGWGGTTKDVTI